MRNSLIILASCLALGAVAVLASDRLRVIKVDSAVTPVASAAASPALTDPTTGTITVSTGTATWTPLYRTITVLDSTTNPVTLVICTNAPAVTAVTNVTAAGSAYGFTSAQAAALLTNSSVFYNLLQSY